MSDAGEFSKLPPGLGASATLAGDGVDCSPQLAHLDWWTSLTDAKIAVILLDRAGRISGLTPTAQALLALEADDAGKPIDDVLGRNETSSTVPVSKQRKGDDQTVRRSVLRTRTGRVFLRFDQSLVEAGPAAMTAATFVEITGVERAEEQVREILAESQATTAKFRVLFDQNPYMAGVLDLRGVITDVNQTALTAGGYCREECIGKPFWETPWWRGSKDVQETIRTAIAAAVGGEPFRATLPYWVADGRQRYTDFGITPVFDDHQRVVFLVPTGADVTERKLLEENLDQNMQQMAMALRAGRMATWIWTPEESIWSDEVFDLLGIDRQETPSSERFFESVHPADRAQLQEAWREATSGAGAYDHEFRIIRPDGKIRWLRGVGEVQRSPDGTVAKIHGLNWDITRQKRSQQREERAAETEHFLLEATSALAKSLDYRETLAEVTRLCVPTLADWAFTDLVDDDGTVQRIAVAHADPEDAELAGEVAQFPADARWKDHPPAQGLFGGKGILIEDFSDEMLSKAARNQDHQRVMQQVGPKSLAVAPLSGRGKTIGALTLVSAKSGRRLRAYDLKVAEELARRASIAIDNARLYAEAQHANRAKSDFLANMSHEIRTPMTAVLGYADLLATTDVDVEQKKYIEIIKRNGDYLLDLINDILDLSKIEAGKFDLAVERFQLQHILTDLESTMRIRAQAKQLEFEVRYAGAVPSVVETDPKRLRQILVNLTGNAIKFTERGRVCLSIDYLADADPPALRLSVSDTGIGIAPEQVDQLFEAFSQGDASVTRKFGGTGLGLAISQRLAEKLGGEITVDSTLGRGSTFTCTIRAGAGADAPMIPAGGSTVETPVARLPEVIQLDCRILVVDDRRDVRFLTEQILSKAGASVDLANDGLDAIQQVDAAAQRGETWDLVFLDMQMPRLDGYQTAMRLRKSGFESPIIALTADAMQGDMEFCLQCGCDAYLSKPIDADQLLKMAARYAGANRTNAT